jgi:hypothetical protein
VAETGMKSTKTYVLAKKHWEYAEFLKVFERSRNDSVFVSCPTQLYGRPVGSVLIAVGDYRDHKDYPEIFQQINVRHFKVVEVNFQYGI